MGLEPWGHLELEGRDGQTVTVTAVPAQHGPDGSDAIQGPVIGFVLSAAGAERVYVSGDNASLDVVRAMSERVGDIAIAVLFAGAVQLARKFDGAYLTLSSDHAADAAKILGVRRVVPVHFEGWTHFTQNADALRAAFAGNGISERLVCSSPEDRPRSETRSAADRLSRLNTQPRTMFAERSLSETGTGASGQRRSPAQSVAIVDRQPTNQSPALRTRFPR